MVEIQPEPISYPFSVYDADGNIIYRDALTFPTAQDFRNTSTAEREAMMQDRYNAWVSQVEEMKAREQEAESSEGA